MRSLILAVGGRSYFYPWPPEGGQG